jgi:hypothetical protein
MTGAANLVLVITDEITSIIIFDIIINTAQQKGKLSQYHADGAMACEVTSVS